MRVTGTTSPVTRSPNSWSAAAASSPSGSASRSGSASTRRAACCASLPAGSSTSPSTCACRESRRSSIGCGTITRSTTGTMLRPTWMSPARILALKGSSALRETIAEPSAYTNTSPVADDVEHEATVLAGDRLGSALAGGAKTVRPPALRRRSVRSTASRAARNVERSAAAAVAARSPATVGADAPTPTACAEGSAGAGAVDDDARSPRRIKRGRPANLDAATRSKVNGIQRLRRGKSQRDRRADGPWHHACTSVGFVHGGVQQVPTVASERPRAMPAHRTSAVGARRPRRSFGDADG